MNTDDLRRLAERADRVEGRQGDRLSELHGRIRTARRRRTAVGAFAAAGVVVALVAGGAALTSTTDRTQQPVDDDTPRPTPTQPVETPTGQVTIQPEIGPGDIQGWELRGSRTNAQAGFAGATDLSLTVETGGLFGPQSHIASFCNGDPDTWWVLTLDLGGADGQRNPDGSMQDGTRGLYGQCSRDEPSAVPPATGDIGPWQWDEAAMAYPMRMFVTDAIPSGARRCIAGTDTYGCLATHEVVPLEDTDASFGFGVYEHLEAPIVMTAPGARFQALAIADGVEYLVERAVVAAKGASRLVVQMPASDRPRIVAVTHSETAEAENCAEQLNLKEPPSSSEEEMANYEKVVRHCVAEVELRVDGKLPGQQDDSSFAEQQVVLPPGDGREVTVEVVKNDPRIIRYALVIWEAR